MMPGLQFTLLGFIQDGEFRVFTFENTGVKSARMQYRVHANISLSRKYAIQLQELPLLCCGLLKRLSASEGARSFIFTEEEMAVHATTARRKADLRRKPPRKLPARILDPGGGK